MQVDERGGYASKRDTPRQVAPVNQPVCRRSLTVFQTSLNVARDASARADAFKDLGLLIPAKACD
jgi:hypothetical protein